MRQHVPGHEGLTLVTFFIVNAIVPRMMVLGNAPQTYTKHFRKSHFVTSARPIVKFVNAYKQ